MRAVLSFLFGIHGSQSNSTKLNIKHVLLLLPLVRCCLGARGLLRGHGGGLGCEILLFLADLSHFLMLFLQLVFELLLLRLSPGLGLMQLLLNVVFGQLFPGKDIIGSCLVSGGQLLIWKHYKNFCNM